MPPNLSDSSEDPLLNVGPIDTSAEWVLGRGWRASAGVPSLGRGWSWMGPATGIQNLNGWHVPEVWSPETTDRVQVLLQSKLYEEGTIALPDEVCVLELGGSDWVVKSLAWLWRIYVVSGKSFHPTGTKHSSTLCCLESKKTQVPQQVGGKARPETQVPCAHSPPCTISTRAKVWALCLKGLSIR